MDNVEEETEQFDLKLYIDAAGYGLGLQNGNNKNATAFIIQPNITGNDVIILKQLHKLLCYFSLMYSFTIYHVILCVGVIVEFKESIYSVIEDVSIYNVTVVKKGYSMQNITVTIIPFPEMAKCGL